MTLQEHIAQAQSMIRALPVIDDAARDAIANAISSESITRSEVTDMRLRLRNMSLLSPDGGKAKLAVDKVLLGLMTKLPQGEPQEKDPAVDTQAYPRHHTRKGATPNGPEGETEAVTSAVISGAQNVVPPKSVTRMSIFELLISTAIKDKDAKKLSLAFWEKLAIEIERQLK